MRDLAGECALVTGAGQRLGAAIALGLARHGVHVAVHYRDSLAGAEAVCLAARALGVRAVSVAADLADSTQLAELLPQARARLGPITLLINSAAIFEPDGFLTQAPDAWERHLAINLTAPFRLMSALAQQPEFRARQAVGGVVNIVDQRIRRPQPGHLSYTTTKSGLWTLTQLAARELAPRIRVNAVAPGPILPAPGDSEERFAAIGQATPLARAGQPEDIVEAVLFLLRHDYITGELLYVDGGEHL